MSTRVPGVGSGGSTEVTNLFHDGKDAKSSQAARTVDGGAAMMMLVLTVGISREVLMCPGVQVSRCPGVQVSRMAKHWWLNTLADRIVAVN